MPGTADLPVPGVAAHVLQRAGGLPAEQAGGLVGPGVAGGDVPGAARHDAIRHRAATGGGKGVDHLQHAVALAGAEVDDVEAGLRQMGQGRPVAAGEVGHVDVVAHAGAVGRGVVVAEDVDMGQLPRPRATGRA
jgi:hypothetical protein